MTISMTDLFMCLFDIKIVRAKCWTRFWNSIVDYLSSCARDNDYNMSLSIVCVCIWNVLSLTYTWYLNPGFVAWIQRRLNTFTWMDLNIQWNKRMRGIVGTAYINGFYIFYYIHSHEVCNTIWNMHSRPFAVRSVRKTHTHTHIITMLWNETWNMRFVGNKINALQLVTD